jgi:hypothetical protein
LGIVLLEALEPDMPAVGMPSAVGGPSAACPFGPVAGASPGIRSSSRCLSARPLAFLGISPPSVGAHEQAGVRRTEKISPRSKTDLPPSPTEQSAPKTLLCVFTIRRSSAPHNPSRTGSQVRVDPLWWLKNFQRFEGAAAAVGAPGATLWR